MHYSWYPQRGLDVANHSTRHGPSDSDESPCRVQRMIWVLSCANRDGRERRDCENEMGCHLTACGAPAHPSSLSLGPCLVYSHTTTPISCVAPDMDSVPVSTGYSLSPPPPTPTSHSPKRRRVDRSSSSIDPIAGPRPTQRAPKSCLECTRRKIKCDKDQPCGACVSRTLDR
jgi:hypothetical protein